MSKVLFFTNTDLLCNVCKNIEYSEHESRDIKSEKKQF